MRSDHIDACIFDLDGVIVDTAKYHFASWQTLAKTFHYDFKLEDNESLKGVSRMKSLEIILELAGVKKTLEERRILCGIKNENYLKQINTMTIKELLPGVIEFIRSLRQMGIKIALGSASRNARLILSKLNIMPLFDAVVDGNQVEKGKPNPEVFIKAAEKIGARPKYSVVFEDAAKGVDAAKAAGMFVIGVGEQEKLPKADFVISGFEKFTTADLAEVSRLFGTTR